MGWLGNWGPLLRREYRAGFANPEPWLHESLGAVRTYSGHSVTAEKAFKLGPVFAAVTIISETIGTLPLKVYQELPNGEKIENKAHRCYRMLHDKPNSMTIASRFWATVANHVLLWGNAFLEKGRDPFTGLVTELGLFLPWKMEVETNGIQKRFKYTPEGDLQPRTLSVDDVCHIVGPSLDGVVGRSAIGCRQLLGTAMAREEFEGNFYGTGAILRGVIEHPGRLSRRPEDKTLEKLRDQWQSVYGGAKSKYDTAILEEGATFKALTMPLEDMQFVESSQMSRTDIAVIFRLPPSYLGGSTGDSLTYATKEANTSQMAQLAISPLTNLISESLNNDPGIFPQDVNFAEFVLEALMQADQKAQAEMFKIYYDMGVIDADYIAARMNFPPPKEKEPPAVPPTNGNGNGNGQVRIDALENALRSS